MSIDLNKILKDHKLWLINKSEGFRADLAGANLFRANLARANLARANLSGADLSRANLSRANLFRTDLSKANLSGADLSRANLSRANLSGTNLFRTKGIIHIQLMPYDIYCQLDKIKIGCHYKSIEEWMEVTKEQAVDMGLTAKFYDSYRIMIEAAHKALEISED